MSLTKSTKVGYLLFKHQAGLGSLILHVRKDLKLTAETE